MAAWDEIAFPILHEVGDHESMNPVNVSTLSEELGLDPMATANELDRLIESGYLAGDFRKMSTGGNPGPWFLMPTRLAKRGARAVGMWPSGNAGDVLLAVLQAAQEAEPDPERKSRLARASEALGGLAKDLLTELTVSVVKGAAGLP
jgi:hypothetical protein